MPRKKLEKALEKSRGIFWWRNFWKHGGIVRGDSGGIPGEIYEGIPRCIRKNPKSCPEKNSRLLQFLKHFAWNTEMNSVSNIWWTSEGIPKGILRVSLGGISEGFPGVIPGRNLDRTPGEIPWVEVKSVEEVPEESWRFQGLLEKPSKESLKESRE